MDEIGKRLKAFLKDNELSVSDFSTLVGIQRSSLSHIFTGRNKPSVDLLLKIKKAFPKVSIEWLITGEEEITKPDKIDQTNIKEEKTKSDMVTNVTTPVVSADYQPDKDNNRIENTQTLSNNEIDKIVIFYKNGSFELYKSKA